jgi:hypothetical protein
MELKPETTYLSCFTYMEVRGAKISLRDFVYCIIITNCQIGGFISGSKDGVLSQPGGMILQSVDNGHPIIHVEINYRLNGKFKHQF